jgi:hypothetical protein
MARAAVFGVYGGQARRRAGLVGARRGGQGVLLESCDTGRGEGKGDRGCKEQPGWNPDSMNRCSYGMQCSTEISGVYDQFDDDAKRTELFDDPPQGRGYERAPM